MMKRFSLPLICIFIAGMLITSCTKEELEFGIDNPVEMELSTQWTDGSVNVGQNEVWFRVPIGADVNQVYVEWSEKDYHGDSHVYTADVIVDAYWLDGETEYFVDKNKGYGADARLISVSSSSGLLIRVRLNPGFPGSFGLKVYEKESSGDLELVSLELGEAWHEASIAEGETLGFLISGGVAGQEVNVVWAEFDSPETGYTADIKGSVLMLDQETNYTIASNGKSFAGKDASHSDNPKGIVLDKGETEFVVVLTLNDPTKQGTFALQIK